MGTVTLTIDASNQGFGGFIEQKFYQEPQSGKEKRLHINHLELKAVYKSILHFFPYLNDVTILQQFLSSTRWQVAKITYAMSQNMEPMEISNSKQNFLSCSLSRTSYLHCRSPIQRKDSAHRVVSEESGFETDYQYQGETNDGPFCIEIESQDSNS